MRQAFIFTLSLAFSHLAVAADYLQIPYAQTFKYNSVPTIGIGASHAMGAWISRASVVRGAGPGKAWVLGAGHTVLGTGLLNGKSACNHRFKMPAVPTPMAVPVLRFNGIKDPAHPKRIAAQFAASRVVYAVTYPVDSAILELDATEADLVAIGIKPLQLAERLPEVGDRLQGIGLGVPDRTVEIIGSLSLTWGALTGHGFSAATGATYLTSMYSWSGSSGGPVWGTDGRVVATIEGGGPDSVQIDEDIAASHQTVLSPALWIREVLREGDIDCAAFAAKMRELTPPR